MLLTKADDRRPYRAIIDGVGCEGIVYVRRLSYATYFYLCQNERSGADIVGDTGYKYSWGVIEDLDRQFDVSSFEFLDETDKVFVCGSASFNKFLIENRDKSKVVEMVYDRSVEYITTEQINYLANRSKAISYLPAGKEHIVVNGQWKREGRQEGKPAKVIRKLFTPAGLAQLTDKDFEIFANLYKAVNDDEGEFRIVEGEEIRDWYSDDKYANGCGSLNASCMRYNSCRPYFDLYCKNSQVKLLILVKDGYLLARALMWKCEEFTIVDRVYGSDSNIVRFHEWAEDNGHAYRKENGDIIYNCEEWDETINIKLDKTDFKYYPYVDTFRYLSDWGVSNGYSRDMKGELDRQDGGPFVGSTCARCGDSMDEDDECHVPDYGTCCSGCAVYCEHSEEYILDGNSGQCRWSRMTYHEDYLVETREGKLVYMEHDDLVCLEDGTYTHRDNTFTCEHDGSTYHSDDCTQIDVDGDTYNVYDGNVEDWYDDNTFKCEHDDKIHHNDNLTEVEVDGKTYQLWDDNEDNWLKENTFSCDHDQTDHLKENCRVVAIGDDKYTVFQDNIEAFIKSMEVTA